MVLVAENALVPEIPGRSSKKVSKLLGEVADGVKTNDGRHLLDGHSGVFEETGGLDAPFPVQKGNKGHAHFLAELMGQVVRVYGELFCGLLHRQIAVEVVFDIDDSLVDQTAEILIRLFLHQTAILLNDVGAEWDQHFRRAETLYLQTDLVGQMIQCIRMHTRAFQGMAKLCI